MSTSTSKSLAISAIASSRLNPDAIRSSIPCCALAIASAFNFTSAPTASIAAKIPVASAPSSAGEPIIENISALVFPSLSDKSSTAFLIASSRDIPAASFAAITANNPSLSILSGSSGYSSAKSGTPSPSVSVTLSMFSGSRG